MSAIKHLSQTDMNSNKIINLADGTSAQDAATKAMVDAAQAFAISRTNHTGTQLAATISDFNTAVRLNRLDQMAAPTGSVAFGSQKITGLADPTNPQEGATKAYVDATVSALGAGLVFKGAVRVATASNVNLATPGTTIDGVTMSNGDLFLATAQTTGSQNGPYVFNGSAVAATRATNWDVAGEATPGSMWVVQQGTFDNQLAILSNNPPFVLGTDTGTFVYLNPAGAADNDTAYSETSPVTSAGAAWAVNHNLGSKLVITQVFRTASPFDEVPVNITRDTTNQVNVRADVALASGEFTIVVAKVI